MQWWYYPIKYLVIYPGLLCQELVLFIDTNVTRFSSVTPDKLISKLEHLPCTSHKLIRLKFCLGPTFDLFRKWWPVTNPPKGQSQSTVH